MKVRKPTKAEKKELLEYYKRYTGGDDFSDEIDEWYIGVFENYYYGHSWYHGKILVLVNTHEPYAETFTWADGKFDRADDKLPHFCE